ncbi:MAG TPA: cellulase family glycosylhydrolase [Tepidisphaeraceae bacterium]|nr:cellulase family glycosylhydrolase [Tepidisphaeraceae bacterium]
MLPIPSQAVRVRFRVPRQPIGRPRTAAVMLETLEPRTLLSYSVSGADILRDGIPTIWRGVNAMHVYGVGSADMNAWGIDIVREPITRMKDSPITGGAQQINGTWWHSLQNIVNDNRAHGKVTILCPFGWLDTNDTKFVGQNPSQTYWWNDYLARMRQIATQFRDQPDVWIEVWNEPYWWDRSHGYSDNLWLSDMRAMVDNIRSTGNQNIVVVPGAESGQDEDVLLAKGAELLQGRSNIVFDVHAYENWNNSTESNIENRLRALKNARLPVMIGEIGPFNSSTQMDPTKVMRAAERVGVTVIAWLWKREDTASRNSLRTTSGAPNDNQNGNWGSTWREYNLSMRNRLHHVDFINQGLSAVADRFGWTRDAAGRVYRTDAGNAAMLTGHSVVDGAVVGRVRLANTTGGAGIIARAQSGSEHYQLTLHRTNGVASWSIARRAGNTTTTLASGSYNWSVNVSYDLRLTLVGTSLTAAVKPSTSTGSFTYLGTATDSTWSSGAVGLRDWGGAGRFESIEAGHYERRLAPVRPPVRSPVRPTPSVLPRPAPPESESLRIDLFSDTRLSDSAERTAVRTILSRPLPGVRQ